MKRNPKLINGSFKKKTAEALAVPVEKINNWLQNYHQLEGMHGFVDAQPSAAGNCIKLFRFYSSVICLVVDASPFIRWLKLQQAKGKKLPETQEEATAMMLADPKGLSPKSMGKQRRPR